MSTTYNFTHFTHVTPNGGSTGLSDDWTVASATQIGTTSITESKDIVYCDSGGFGTYHSAKEVAEDGPLPFHDGPSGLLVYDGTFGAGRVRGVLVYVDAVGLHYLVTDGDPGYTGGESFSATEGNVCFGEGTMISTPDGAKTVETLEIGDLITTIDGDVVDVKWVGVQSVLKLSDVHGRRAPVRIDQGALGDGLPNQDLYVTAEHALFLDGLLVNASALVNGDGIQFVPRHEMPDASIYYHVETQNHDMIVANGVAAETFVDETSRRSFSNYQDYLDLFGEERLVHEAIFSRVTSSRLVPDSLKSRLGQPDYYEYILAS